MASRFVRRGDECFLYAAPRHLRQRPSMNCKCTQTMIASANTKAIRAPARCEFGDYSGAPLLCKGASLALESESRGHEEWVLAGSGITMVRRWNSVRHANPVASRGSTMRLVTTRFEFLCRW